MTEMCVSVATHHFVVTRINPRVRPAIDDFARSLIHYEFKRGRGGAFQKEPAKVFAAALKSRKEFRFHINHMDKFKETLRKFFINDGMVEWKKIPLVELPTIDFTIHPEAFSPKDYQEPVIDYIAKDEGPISRLVDLQTGRGKTFCALRGISLYRKRFVMILKPAFVEQWVQEIKKAYSIKDKEICTITGSKQLISLLNMASNEDYPYKAIIISNATYRNWLSVYEQHGREILEMGYACLPQDLFQHLQADFRLIDEVHMDFHLNFKCDLYTNVGRSLSLSATLLSDNDFIGNMMKVAYPLKDRYVGGDYVKYVNSFFLTYRFREPERIRFTEYGSTTYTHHVFEQTVIKQPRVLQNYFNMIASTIDNTYIKHYLPGQRCLIYCASIDLCTRLVSWLKGRYPNKDIRRYVEDDPFEDIIEAEISVSTVGSAGTGLDIPRLATVILTNAVNSSQSNIQGFGRLRQPKDGSVPEFVYFVCEDIVKHWDYHEKKAELLASRALSNTKRVYSDLL